MAILKEMIFKNKRYKLLKIYEKQFDKNSILIFFVELAKIGAL